MTLKIEINLSEIKPSDLADYLTALAQTLPDALDISREDFTALSSTDGSRIVGRAFIVD